MTEKRFEVVMNEFDEVEYIMDKEMMEDRDFADFIDFVEDVCKENEQLKKREEQLLSEIKDFQQLLTKNDNICCKRVIDLIDVRIKNGEEAIEWGKNMNADYGAMGFHIEMLKKLKKDLEE